MELRRCLSKVFPAAKLRVPTHAAEATESAVLTPAAPMQLLWQLAKHKVITDIHIPLPSMDGRQL